MPAVYMHARIFVVVRSEFGVLALFLQYRKGSLPGISARVFIRVARDPCYVGTVV